MTTEERDLLETAKEGVTTRLSRLDISAYRLSDTDIRLEQYTMEVAGNPDRHNLWEQLAVERFFGMIDRYGLDTKAVKRFFTFYEYLYFPGKRGLRRYRLTPVQAFQFASVYGFTRDDGRRVVREAVLYVPRKFSKTTGSAAFAIYDLLYGDANAEAYVGANSQDQAKKCFDVIRGCMRRLDPDERQFVINEQMVKPTRAWAEKGYLKILPGEVIDYDAIADYILGLNDKVRTLGIGYDPYKSKDVLNLLVAGGAESVLRPISQTYGSFNSAVESFEVCVRTGRIAMNDNPVNWYCFGNAVLDEDRLENVKPIKRQRSQKIDGVVTMLMCHKMFMDSLRMI